MAAAPSCRRRQVSTSRTVRRSIKHSHRRAPVGPAGLSDARLRPPRSPVALRLSCPTRAGRLARGSERYARPFDDPHPRQIAGAQPRLGSGLKPSGGRSPIGRSRGPDERAAGAAFACGLDVHGFVAPRLRGWRRSADATTVAQITSVRIHATAIRFGWVAARACGSVASSIASAADRCDNGSWRVWDRCCSIAGRLSMTAPGFRMRRIGQFTMRCWLV